MSGGCKCRPIPAKRNVKAESNVVVSECTVYVTAYYTLPGYQGRGRFNTQNTPNTSLVMALSVIQLFCWYRQHMYYDIIIIIHKQIKVTLSQNCCRGNVDR